MPDTEKEALCARIDELCAEVEALRCEKPRTMLSVTARHVADLLAENAKLRELVRVMAYCNQYSPDCDGCSMNGAAGIITERVGCDELLARLRGLGLEAE